MQTRFQALASGDVQVLYAVGATSVILSAANGADIKVLNMYSRSPEGILHVLKDDTLTSPESLKGKTIAGPTGTNLHELLVSYLAQADMTLDDVNYVNMSIPDAKAGLDGGSVDVALLGRRSRLQRREAGLSQGNRRRRPHQSHHRSSKPPRSFMMSIRK